MGARISIQLLGPVRVEVAGAPLAVDTRKAIALLAYLAVTGRPASRESLAALLWPEADGADARAALRRTLSVLNAGLGAGALSIDRTSVTLHDDAAELDLRRFRAALGRARGHQHEPDAACRPCIRALDEALALDRGEFMSGFALRDSEAFDEWQVAEAESHRRDLAGALERLARSLAAAGVTERALVAGRRWLELDPLHEPAHRLLMELLARAENRRLRSTSTRIASGSSTGSSESCPCRRRPSSTRRSEPDRLPALLPQTRDAQKAAAPTSARTGVTPGWSRT